MQNFFENEEALVWWTTLTISTGILKEHLLVQYSMTLRMYHSWDKLSNTKALPRSPGQEHQFELRIKNRYFLNTSIIGSWMRGSNHVRHMSCGSQDRGFLIFKQVCNDFGCESLDWARQWKKLTSRKQGWLSDRHAILHANFLRFAYIHWLNSCMWSSMELCSYDNCEPWLTLSFLVSVTFIVSL